MRKKRYIALGIFFVILVVNILRPVGNLNISDISEKKWKEEVYKAGGLDTIALLEIDGIIQEGEGGGLFGDTDYNHEVFLQQLEHAFSNEGIKGIVLHVNTPGGEVMASDEIYQRIMHWKKEYKKPIVVYMGQMAASGGYYVSAPADKIYANRNTLTGSIGVIFGSLNYKELMDNVGIKDQSFVSGPNKAIMSAYQEMTEEQKEIMQELVDESYQFFVDAIVEGRGLERTKVLELADGRIYSGTQAKNLGLVDELGFLDDALEGAAQLAGVDEPTVLRFKADGWPSFGGFLAQIPSLSKDARLVQELMMSRQHPTLMYIWNG